MFKGINEIIEYVELDGDKSFRLLSFLTTAGIAYIIYEEAGGTTTIPAIIGVNFWIEFFVSFQVFIPIILFFIAWYVSRFISSSISFLFRALFEYIYFKFFTKSESKSIEEIKKSGSKEVLKILLNFLSKTGITVNIHKLNNTTEIQLIEGLHELLGDIEDRITDKFVRFWVICQLLFIYLTKFENSFLFTGNLNKIVLLILILIPVFDLLNIVALASFKKISVIYMKALEAEMIVITNTPK